MERDNDSGYYYATGHVCNCILAKNEKLLLRVYVENQARDFGVPFLLL